MVDSFKLSLRSLEAHDPQAGGSGAERRFRCPLSACDGKPKRSLAVHVGNGLWHCHRCGAKGLLLEFQQEQKPPANQRQARQGAILQRAFGVGSAGVTGAGLADATPAPVTPGDPAQGDAAATAPVFIQAATKVAPNVTGAAAARAAHGPGMAPAVHGPGMAPAVGTRQDTDEDTAKAPAKAPAMDWLKQLDQACALAATPGAAYLRRRALPVELAHEAGIVFAPRFYGRPAIAFPICDLAGARVAVNARFIDQRRDPPAQTAGPKKLGLFATPGAIQDGKLVEPIIITEAPLDALSLAAAGYPALALCGKEGYPAWLLTQCAYRSVFIGFDADAPGDAAAATLMTALLQRGAPTHRLRPERAKDWNEFLMEWGVAALADWLTVPVLGGVGAAGAGAGGGCGGVG